MFKFHLYKKDLSKKESDFVRGSGQLVNMLGLRFPRSELEFGRSLQFLLCKNALNWREYTKYGPEMTI